MRLIKRVGGTFRFTRTGELSCALTVNDTVSGTATSGTDYTALGGTVTFAAGYATADVTVTAATDTIYDPDETIVVTVASGTGYTVGTGASDTVTIANDDETVETLIHQQTFQLAGSSGNVNVTLTVTYNKPGAPGLYTWVYEVTNPSENTDPLTGFSVPVDEMDSDVTSLASSLGWTGTAGIAGVSWAAGTGRHRVLLVHHPPARGRGRERRGGRHGRVLRRPPHRTRTEAKDKRSAASRNQFLKFRNRDPAVLYNFY